MPFVAGCNHPSRVIDSASAVEEVDRYSNLEEALVGEVPWC